MKLVIKAIWAAFVVIGTVHAERFLDDFSTDTSANYIGTMIYGRGAGGFAVSNGVLTVRSSANTTYDVFHRTAKLEVGEAVCVVSRAGNLHDLYLSISTTTCGPNTGGHSGIRLNWTDSGSFEARVYNQGRSLSKAFGGKIAVGTELMLYIARTAETVYVVGYDAGRAGSAELAHITIEGTAGRKMHVGVEGYAAMPSFDNLEILDFSVFPVINSLTLDPLLQKESERGVTLAGVTSNAVETTLNGEVVAGTATIHKVSKQTSFTLVSTSRNGFSVSRALHPSVMVDPCFPADRQALQVDSPETLTGWPRKRIQQLEAERDRLLAKISVLPQHNPIFLSSQLGYHSPFEKVGSEGSLSPHQIDFKFHSFPVLDSIALAPAFNSNKSGPYAFPKRFKIEVLDQKTGKFEMIVNWMDEDFPDPGPYPVFFSGINRLVRAVRLTVLPEVQEPGVAYFALGEVFLFRQALDGAIGDNAAAWGHTGIKVEASGSFSGPPYWDLQYLHDGGVEFGFPLSDRTVEGKDLMITYDNDASFSDKVQITLDLGHQKKIGRVDFWPGAPYLLAFPSLGFPREIVLELSPDPDFKTVKVLRAKNANGEGKGHRENLLLVITKAYKARYIRITMEGLSKYKGKRILGIGEISVSEFGRVLSANCTVTAEGIPDEFMDQLPRLVDGCSQQRLILPQGEWIKGLARRRPLDRRLVEVEEDLQLAKDVWRRIKQRSIILAGSILAIVLVGGLVLQRQMRKRGITKLKQRIARDLHDDVGSILGSISFSTEQLKCLVEGEEAKENLFDLSLMASEACASLREVVWVINANTIHLPMLIQKLLERADRILRGAGLSVESTVDCPDCIVSLTCKRHLIMFFKEVVHNCARHAKANRVWVDFSTADQHLRISFRDNGCGFDPSKATDGWGLGSMKDRAAEMGGKLELNSRIGEGTSVVLTIPLTALLSKTDHLYNTSN